MNIKHFLDEDLKDRLNFLKINPKNILDFYKFKANNRINYFDLAIFNCDFNDFLKYKDSFIKINLSLTNNSPFIFSFFCNTPNYLNKYLNTISNELLNAKFNKIVLDLDHIYLDNKDYYILNGIGFKS